MRQKQHWFIFVMAFARLDIRCWMPRSKMSTPNAWAWWNGIVIDSRRLLRRHRSCPIGWAKRSQPFAGGRSAEYPLYSCPPSLRLSPPPTPGLSFVGCCSSDLAVAWGFWFCCFACLWLPPNGRRAPETLWTKPTRGSNSCRPAGGGSWMLVAEFWPNRARCGRSGCRTPC